MIGMIRGHLLWHRHRDIIVDVSGVGYELQVTSSVLDNLPELSTEVKLIVYTDVKENAINLFGFSSTLEREVFLMLKTVKGVGSKLALGIISSLGAEKILSAIGSSDLSILVSASGVGKKTAERVLVELQEKVLNYIDNNSVDVGIAKTTSINSKIQTSKQDFTKDAIDALSQLGFSHEVASLAVGKAMESATHKDAGALLKAALSEL